MSFESFARVLPATARVNAVGRLEIGGCDAVELARELGTPLYVLDETSLRDRLRRYREVFGPRCVHYAAKAFLTASLVPYLVEEDVGLDCASGGELYTALAGGFPAPRVIVHGNNKSGAELTQAVEHGVGRIVLDSGRELDLLELVARHAGARPRVLIRVTPGIEARTHEYLKTGIEDSKFGVPIGGPALELARRTAASRHVELVGLHSHIGSQVLELEPFAEAGRVMVRFLAEAREATGLELPELDLGGGLGIAYEPSETPPEIEALGKVLREAVSSEADAAGTPMPRIGVEPGRSVIGPTMVTLYTCGAIKEVPGIGVRYAAVDGGMSDNVRPALYGARYTFLSADRPQDAHDTEYAVAGKLCETGDVLRRGAMLPSLEPGEIIACAATGAYGYAMASNYNRQPRPAIVAVGEGRTRVLARRETYEDLVRLELP